jgi:ubiquinone/menaquinone biosynthesis C-methylase UbiE
MSSFFSKHYDNLMGLFERKWFSSIRAELLRKVKGHVLEIGAGTGINFPYYVHVDSVIAIEPNPIMLEKAKHRAVAASADIQVKQGNAEHLPFADGTFDTVVCTLVLCSVENPKKVLNELKRVCKPEGSLLFFEHVRLRHKFFGGLQDVLTPVWKHMCDGCHLNRQSIEDIKQAGFKVVRIKRYLKKIFVVVEAVNQRRNLSTK